MTNQKSKVVVFYKDGMAISFGLRETIDTIRRNLIRLDLPGIDIRVYTSDEANSGVFVRLTQGMSNLVLKNKNGGESFEISPNTLLATLKDGYRPFVKE